MDVELVQNSVMSAYEEFLTLGQHLHDRERIALYQFLLESEKVRYLENARQLEKTGTASAHVADGEILFELKKGSLTYSARKKGDSTFNENLRQINLTDIPYLRKKRMLRFFAQSEVDVIWNFPLPGNFPQEASTYTINLYPYFDLRYFSNGRGRLLGLLKRLQMNNSEILEKLRAS